MVGRLMEVSVVSTLGTVLNDEFGSGTSVIKVDSNGMPMCVHTCLQDCNVWS